ncbi:MAG: ATP-grasp domain-containing protein [Chloroflexi bacterium]|nr:ATP-grasp domain-containing protein [Chloroflexota bacterium]
MRPKIAVIYNEPAFSRYDAMGEQKAVLGVLDALAAVDEALDELGYPAFRVPLSPPLEQVGKSLNELKADLVFNLFEGFDGQPGTEAIVADMLSKLGLPYTGCAGKTLALALDKARTKAVLEASGIATPRGQVLNAETVSKFHLDLPCIVKPLGEDASHGLTEESLVSDSSALLNQVTLVSNRFGGQALVEEFMPGREFNATVMGNTRFTVLPVSEIVYSLPGDVPKILTFAAKWEEDNPYFHATAAVCPAQIEDSQRECISNVALSAYKALGCRGYARVDMRYDGEGKLNVIEVNSNPDISPGTGAARQAKACGMSYNEFIEKIVLLALRGD